MTIEEIKIRTLTLDSTDIKQAIIMYTKARGENEIKESDIELNPAIVAATITLTEKIDANKTAAK